MSQKTSIEWVKNANGEGHSWNPLRGCSRISPGCTNCYAEQIAGRFSGIDKNGKTLPFSGIATKTSGQSRWTGKITFDEKILLEPLKRKEPTTYFISMSDLFHENVMDVWIDKIFAVIAMTPHHTFQILTKRPERMKSYLLDYVTPFRIAKAKDGIEVQVEIAKSVLEIKPIEGYPNYYISNFGNVYSGNGSQQCVNCGVLIDGLASKKYCSSKCAHASHYQRSKGNLDKFKQTLVAMSPDVGEQGHKRVMLYVGGKSQRELVHRLVLSAFDRPANEDEQGCHKNGNPENNHIANLRWGTQSDNWEDRKRHGNSVSYSKLSDEDVVYIRESLLNDETVAYQFKISSTQVRNIRKGEQWNVESEIKFPLANVMLGVSCENQQTADERIPFLIDTPAAVRFLSCEPLLGEIDLSKYLFEQDTLAKVYPDVGLKIKDDLNWVICGGESGHGARACDVKWIRRILEQCKQSNVPCFVKQLGAVPYESPYFEGDTGYFLPISDKKGGVLAEFPLDLQVREFPVKV